MPIPASLTDRVGTILREAAAEAILPRFGRLREQDVSEKSPGELVTIADREAEVAISPRLAALVPGSRVVGEEGAAADGSILAALAEGDVWLLDPLDGTANFVKGDERFAVMAALLREGVAVASWILTPATGSLAVAERGAGASYDGCLVATAGAGPQAEHLAGALHSRYMPGDVRALVNAAGASFRTVTSGVGCAGVEYRETIDGLLDFSVYWRTLPWDHVPGTLLLCEAGGHAARLDGTPYAAGDAATGLLAAASEAAWHAAREAFGGALG